ncbi:flagellar assembly peptidoglycan hydrolase FlgJ [Thorsellia anophelis]|uniref:Peptidoglycan hydrolase FlgJ n=1 Tax=Thorsellia anophelis DSM 18579 TaxID=1123402 RepID=A0A1H9ZF52_9GAMM|nr:flagellar assembly peptidoglycan hydrolase FlgJ [Thorsellia anophelis]SES80218.1 flagellar protein FlgJ [Thorsellia anophelis DSM 18579]
MDSPVNIGAFAFDANGLNSLKTAVSKNGNGHLREVANQVEGLFLQMMLKSMRSAVDKDSLFNSNQTELYYSLYDQQLSQELAKNGIGFADELMAHIESAQSPEALKSLSSEMNGGLALDDVTRLLTNDSMPASIKPASLTGLINSNSNFDAIKLAKQSANAFVGNIPEIAGNKVKSLFAGAKDFMNKLSGPAHLASKDTGIHPHLILAQAALESGWGKSEIKTATGETSHNLFGIKAGKSWKGKVTEIVTTEFIDGAYTKVRAKFRVYNDYQHALSDYVDLLTKNPRYQSVLTAPNAEQAAIEIQRAGYATDPKYANKLITIIKQFKSESSKTANQYNAMNQLKI